MNKAKAQETKEAAAPSQEDPHYKINKADMDSLLQEIYISNWRQVTNIANEMREKLQK